MGDFLPLMALARRLQARGHRVCVAVNPALLPEAQQRGLEAAPCGERLGPEDVRRQAHLWDEWRPLSDDERRARLRLFDPEAEFHDLAALCGTADLLVASCLQHAAAWVHEKLGLPWIGVLPSPGGAVHAGALAPSAEEPAIHPDRRELFTAHNEVRRRLGLPELPYRERDWAKCLLSCRVVLVAGSPHFSDMEGPGPPPFRQTGFWLDHEAECWTAPPELAAFLQRPARPLVLTFSSQPVTDPVRVVRAPRRSGGPAATPVTDPARLGRTRP